MTKFRQRGGSTFFLEGDDKSERSAFALKVTC